MSKPWPKKKYTKRTKFNITGVEKKIKAVERVAKFVKIESGFLSRSKKLRPKIFFAVRGGQADANRQPPRTPIPLAKRRIEDGKIRKEFVNITKTSLLKWFKNPQGSVLTAVRRDLKVLFPQLTAELKRDWFMIRPAISKQRKYHKSLIPLVETGRLRDKGIRTRFKRVKRKK